ncbi:MAG: protein translocase subunit SecD [Lachnospiraceae bacterium]|nr:protein translocase subunit SecD [Lachnospiraceae bacterium]
MKKSRAIISLIIIILLLAGLGYTAIFGLGSDQSGSLNSIDLGLDLAGGVSITYEVGGDQAPDAADMADTIYKLQQRVDNYSTEAQVYQEGLNRINIEIPGVTDANKILEELGQPGNLYFIAQTDADGNENYSYGMHEEDIGYVYGYELNKTIEELEAEGSIVLKGTDVSNAQAGYQSSGTAGNQEPVVELEFTPAGTQAFAEATTKAYAAGESIGIYYDGEFISVPNVQAAITDGRAVITGMSDFQDADNLAALIRIGGLKVQLSELRSNVVGAQLGTNAIQSGLIAAAVGFVLIAVFMIVIFKILGLAATVALAFYVELMIILLDAFEITLTLPGIAGIILTIGMAVDANVIVFSRIREEIAKGKVVGEAMKLGYQKALSAILDGNITTVIAAVVLMIGGSGTIKGFAQTLILGIIVSMFTALLITRAVSAVLYGIGIHGEKFYGKAKTPKVFDFVGKRKLFYGISCGIVLIGVIVMIANGARGAGALNWSLDFVGGTSTSVTFNENWTTADLDAQVVPKIKQAVGVDSVQVQTVSGTNQVIFKTTSLDLSQREKLDTMFETDFGVASDNIAAETISSTISGEMLRAAIISVIVALVLMLIYIAIRFRDFKFGGAAIVALAHDALMVVVCYALSRISAGGTFIACILTIIGYSINDTIVTFDRIRENLSASVRNRDIPGIVNTSVAQTLSRSLFTSITTFFMVLCLVIFGVADIKLFAIPLMVGVIAGTYSSIFIASPLWTDFRLTGDKSGPEKKDKQEKKETGN